MFYEWLNGLRPKIPGSHSFWEAVTFLISQPLSSHSERSEGRFSIARLSSYESL